MLPPSLSNLVLLLVLLLVLVLVLVLAPICAQVKSENVFSTSFFTAAEPNSIQEPLFEQSMLFLTFFSSLFEKKDHSVNRHKSLTSSNSNYRK